MDPSLKSEKWLFVSFADGSPLMTNAGKRIASQALKIGVFHSVQVFDGLTLSKVDPVYRRVFNSETSKQRGFGYWVWKPLVIRYLQNAKDSSDEDITGIIYADAGCEIPVNYFSRVNFKKIFDSTKNSAVIADSTSHFEIKYTKKYIFDVLDPQYTHASSPQMSATWIAVRLNTQGRQFINDWAHLATFNDGALINDSTSKEDSRFLENRHDQSLFSILFKQYRFTPYKIEYRRVLGSLTNSMRPIWTSRNRTGESVMRPWVNSSLVALIGTLINVCNRSR
jgi:hypothetical protein